MASIEQRKGKLGGKSWRVVWRENGRKQSEIFGVADDATRFAQLVEASGNTWPHGWVRGLGYAESDPDMPRFADYAERTIAARLRADERTKGEYRRTLRLHVNPHIGDSPLNQVDRFAVARIAEALIRDGKAAKTVANVHGIVSSILSDAVNDGLIPRNPARGALPRLPEVRSEDMAFLTKSEFAQLAAAVTEHYRPLVRFLAGTGMRWSEATALQVQDVDLLDRGVVHVRRAWKRRGGDFVFGEPKTVRSRRTLDLSTELIDLLVPLVAATSPGDLVFVTHDGAPVRHNNFYTRVWVPALMTACCCDTHRPERTTWTARDKWQPCGCPGTLTKRPRIHDLRHTHASWLIDAGVTLPDIQRRLGHESIQTTVDRYGHPSGSRDEINAAVDAALAQR